MRILLVLLILALCVLHHDIWWWDSPGPTTPGAAASSEGILFGFMPIGLAWHTGISIAASILWGLATIYCWPANLDDGSFDAVDGSVDGSVDGAGGSRISGGHPAGDTA